jgi:hypothetical protein
MPASVQSRGPGLKATLIRLRTELHDVQVKVGVFGKANRRRGEGASRIGNVELAVIHEYGAPAANIQARSFIYSTLHANRRQYAQQLQKLMGKVAKNEMSAAQALDILGLKVANDCKTRISQGAIRQNLAPSTIAARRRKFGAGVIRALNDTSQLKNSITHAVSRGGR